VSFLTSRWLLRQTDYLAVWPVQLAELEIMDGSIAALDIPLPAVRRPIGITTRAADVMSPAAARLVESLRRAAQCLNGKALA